MPARSYVVSPFAPAFIPPPVITTGSLPSASLGVAYSQALSATGGIPPYTWSITSILPNTGGWLHLNTSTGVLSGTPGTAETETLNTIIAYDQRGQPSGSITLTLSVAGGQFDFYISPTGDDNNVGSLAHPWSITALGTPNNHTTAACKWTTYSGKRVGVIGGTAASPLVYTVGTYNGTPTTLYSIAEQGPNLCLITNGSSNAGAPTYIANCDSNGNELPGTAAPTAILNYGGGPGNNIPPDWQSAGIGHSSWGLAFNLPTYNNITIKGIGVANCGAYGIVMGDNGHSATTGVTVQSCLVTGNLGFHNDNNGGIQVNGCPGAIIQNNLVTKCYSSAQLFKGACTGYISGTSFTIVSITQGQIFYPGTSTGLVFNGSPTNPAAAIGANTLPSGVTFNAPSANTPGTYTLSVNCGTIGSAGSPVTFYIGFASSSTLWGAYGAIIYNTNASLSTPISLLNNTFFEINLVDLKTNPQNYIISRNVFITGENGTTTSPVTPPLTFNAQAVPGGTGQVDHNVFIGGCFLYEAAAPIGNAGAITVFNNTYYLPKGYNLATGGSVGNCSYEQNATLSGHTGSSNDYNNLFWQDLTTPLPGYCLIGAPTINVTRNNNVYMQGVNPFCTSNGGASISLATMQSTYNFDLTSSVISQSPFASTPNGVQASSYALNPTSPAYTAGVGGAITGAQDGSGSVGCSFAILPTIVTGSLPNATVSVAYSQQLTASGGTGSYTWALVSAVNNWGNAMSVSSSGLLTGTPQMFGTMTLNFSCTDATTGLPSFVTLSLTVNQF